MRPAAVWVPSPEVFCVRDSAVVREGPLTAPPSGSGLQLKAEVPPAVFPLHMASLRRTGKLLSSNSFGLNRERDNLPHTQKTPKTKTTHAHSKNQPPTHFSFPQVLSSYCRGCLLLPPITEVSHLFGVFSWALFQSTDSSSQSTQLTPIPISTSHPTLL